MNYVSHLELMIKVNFSNIIYNIYFIVKIISEKKVMKLQKSI